MEVIELQESAAPFHDWNERINFECYAPNTAARILDQEEYIIKIVNNYTRISFNFGPTLLHWMEKADPATYAAILEADRISRERFSGHGSALAQVHSHVIMPLANRRDKITQIRWGLHDFEHRFGRPAEGIWLAETAVDTETLELLVDHQIRFTILAPRQAKAFRRIGDTSWIDTPHDSIDPRRPYLYRLPSGREIVLFFYHGGIAQEVAFKGLLNDGRAFAQRLVDAFDHNDQPQLMHVATDGESYGHHHHKGEMALAACLNHIEVHQLARITNYGEYLDRWPPEYEALIHENSSWSCVHGVERWRANCGCNAGSPPGWNQAWRAPLRNTLNWLRDQLIPIYERVGTELLRDVWEARNDYIAVLLNRDPGNVDAFLNRHIRRPLDKEEITKVLRCLEMQRNALLMFTSCGWFFDEVSRLETNQILQYANRAIYYADQVAGVDLHAEFMKRLEEAPSNIPEFKNGSISYQKHVVPARVDLVRVGMHYAVASLFEPYPDDLELFNYQAQSEVFLHHEAGIQKLVMGRTTVRSRITLSEKPFSFAVLYLGQQNLIGNISVDMDRATFDEMADRMGKSFDSSSLDEVIRWMQTYFGLEKYSLWYLFLDEKRKILQQITRQNLQRVETSFREIYNDNYQLMTGMRHSSIPLPDAYLSAVQFVVNHDLYQYFSNGGTNHLRDLEHLADEFEKWNVRITNKQSLTLAVSERVFKDIQALNHSGFKIEAIQNLVSRLEILERMGVKPNVWKSQNLFFSMIRQANDNGSLPTDNETRTALARLGDLLKIRQGLV